MTNHPRPLADRMHQAGVGFGTSGARGRVEALDNALCYAITVAFVQHLAATGKTPLRLALAGDRRASTGRILAACAQALNDRDITVVYCGRIPTPALAAFAMAEGIGAVMVTGSHIPEDRNGLKLYTPEGEILKSDEAAIAAQLVAVPTELSSLSPLPAVEPSAARRYVDRFVHAFGTHALVGTVVGAYGHSAVGRDLTVEVLRRLGASVVPLGYSDAFVAVDTEAIRDEDRRLARDWAAQQSFHAIVTTDGDGDRPMMTDASGEWLRGDVVGILAAAALVADVVVTPVSSNTAVERSGLFESVVRTRIGSPYVVAAMQQAQGRVVLGYEANGGLLQHSPVTLPQGVLSPLPTRDALIVLVSVLQRAAQQGCSLAALVQRLPARYTASSRLLAIESDRSRPWLQRLVEDSRAAEVLGPQLGVVVAVDTIDGLRLTFANSEIVHVRPSGNAPELRCYCEAASPARAEVLVADVLRRLSDALS
ncbi:MAG: hypothetical protein JKY37_26420 [Nannocystaceae bacterium]|nr:hypothetical protein [Nannocystaceae bacterium]